MATKWNGYEWECTCGSINFETHVEAKVRVTYDEDGEPYDTDTIEGGPVYEEARCSDCGARFEPEFL